MKLLLYVSESNKTGQHIRTIIQSHVPKRSTEIHRTVASISKRLKMRVGDVSVVILHTATKEEFCDVLSLGSLLESLRIILILPDRERETIAQGLKLRPRFISFTDTDYSDVSAVLGKMLMVYRKEMSL